MRLLFKNIKELVQIRPKHISYVKGQDMNNLPTLKNAYLLVTNGKIDSFGSMHTCPPETADVIDATGKILLPAWCDSHTHLVYAGSREKEFVDRINGLTYEEIANRGGGILNSAQKLQKTTKEDLYNQSKSRLEEVIRLGTGSIEIKSGYGLTLEAEIKMLRVIRDLKKKYQINIKSTFLGAHAIPAHYKNNKQAYLEKLITYTIPRVAEEKLAEYIDIFCETGYFSAKDTDMVLEAGVKYGLKPKIHVNQFTVIGGVQVGVKHNALSVDHLEKVSEADISSLKESSTMPVALPGCSFFLGIPYTPARKIIDSGLPLALATDYNPGSAPSGNMNMIISLACIKMNITPKEAINAATINGAYAMGLEKQAGSITRGKQANLLLTQPIRSYKSLPYSFGTNNIAKVYIQGIKV